MQLHNSFALRAVSVAAALAFAPFANAALVQASSTATGYSATVQGSAYAPTAGNISAVTPSCSNGGGTCPNSNTFTANNGSQLATVSFAGGAAVVSTPNSAGFYAAPVSGPNSVASPFFSTNTTSAGTAGSYTLTFASLQSYLGLLWGSIGTGDLLTFKNGNTVVATVNGTTAQAAANGFNSANGAQNFGGSQYEVINFLNGQFDSVVFSQTIQAAFESANLQYSQTNVAAVPEPGSVLLLGIGVAGLVASRRRKVAKA